MIFAVPLAWLQLTYEKSRLLVAIAGITFAVVLMFLQLGFRDALFNSSIRLQSNLVGDLVVISPQLTLWECVISHSAAFIKHWA